MKYYIVVGEASGDLHASNMMLSIKERDPNAEFRFFGGDRMAAVGGKENLTLHYKEASFMGLWQVLGNLGTIKKQMQLCKQDILDFAPDVLVLVDYAGFNLRIARFAKEQGLKVFYYIAPKAWAWNRSRAKKIKKYVDKLFVIFPFEVDFFKQYGIESYYDGNPIMDAIENNIPPSNEQQDKLWGCPKEQRIALVCGSRKAEVKTNLPFMVRVANQMHSHKFIIAAVPWIDRSLYEGIVAQAPNISIVTDRTYEVVKSASAAIVTSGTATLETALLGTPQVVCYWVSPLSTIPAKMIVKIEFISLVNIVMGREVVRELRYAEKMTTENGVNELEAILPGGKKREKMLADYAELTQKMGSAGASGRVGSRIVELLGGQR